MATKTKAEAPVKKIAPEPQETATQDDVINTTATEPVPSQPENGQGDLIEEDDQLLVDEDSEVPATLQQTQDDQDKPGILPPGGLIDIPEEFKEKAERYKKMYPAAKSIFVTSDGQVFLDKNKVDAKTHQTKIDKKAEVVEIPL